MCRRSSNELRLPRKERGFGRAHVALRPMHDVREEACRQGMALLNEFPCMDDNDNLDAMTRYTPPRRRPSDVRPRGDGKAGTGFGDNVGGEPGCRNRRPLGDAARGGQK